MAIILGGLDGSGKTYGAIQWATAGLEEKPSILLDLEYPRAKKTHTAYFADKQLEILNCKVLYTKTDAKLDIKRGERDPIKSFELFEKNLTYILDNFEKYGCIIIDGISDIRSDYSHVWLKNFNGIDGKRQSIGKDISAWTDINIRIIEQTIAPLQELGDAYNTTVIFTAMMGDDYKLVKTGNGKEDSIKSGTKHIDIHQDIRHKVDTICRLEHDANNYYIGIEKSIKGSTGVKQLTKPLWECLMEVGII